MKNFNVILATVLASTLSIVYVFLSARRSTENISDRFLCLYYVYEKKRINRMTTWLKQRMTRKRTRITRENERNLKYKTCEKEK